MSFAKLGFLVLCLGLPAFAALGTSSIRTSQPVIRKEGDTPSSQLKFGLLRKVSHATVLPVQSKNADQLGVGKVLVASRGLGDPHFMKTVVLLVQYDVGGVVGLILNRRTDLPVSTVLEGTKGAKGRSDLVYSGGPVDPQIVLGLFESTTKARSDGAKQICDRVYQVSSKAQLQQILSGKAASNAMHIYLGYAGWTVDQLKMEMQLGAWFVFAGDSETIFNTDPDSLWPRMIERTELHFARD